MLRALFNALGDELMQVQRWSNTEGMNNDNVSEGGKMHMNSDSTTGTVRSRLPFTSGA